MESVQEQRRPAGPGKAFDILIRLNVKMLNLEDGVVVQQPPSATPASFMTPVGHLATLPRSSYLLTHLEKQKISQILQPPHPDGRPRSSSEIPVLACSAPDSSAF